MSLPGRMVSDGRIDESRPWCYPSLPEFTLRGPSVRSALSNRSYLRAHLRADGAKKQVPLLICVADTVMIVSKKLSLPCFLTKFHPPRAPSVLSDRPKSQGNEDHQSLKKNNAYALLSQRLMKNVLAM